jgi:hypothetical protein
MNKDGYNWKDKARALAQMFGQRALVQKAERIRRQLEENLDPYDLAVRTAVATQDTHTVVACIIVRCKAHHPNNWESAASAQTHHVCKVEFTYAKALVKEMTR